MPTYVTLIHYTDQGVKTFKDLPQRLEDTRKAGGSRRQVGLVLPDDGPIRRCRG